MQVPEAMTSTPFQPLCRLCSRVSPSAIAWRPLACRVPSCGLPWCSVVQARGEGVPVGVPFAQG